MDEENYNRETAKTKQRECENVISRKDLTKTETKSLEKRDKDKRKRERWRQREKLRKKKI